MISAPSSDDKALFSVRVPRKLLFVAGENFVHEVEERLCSGCRSTCEISVGTFANVGTIV